MATFCPHCGRMISPPKPTEVHAEVRGGGEHGLRVDIEFQCDRCGEFILIEDAGVSEGVVNKGTSGFLRRFKGEGYRV